MIKRLRMKQSRWRRTLVMKKKMTIYLGASQIRGRLAYDGLNVQLNLSYITTCHHLSYHCPPHQSRPSYAYYYGCPSPMNTYSCVRRKFGFNKKIRRNLLIVYVYNQPNSCNTHTECEGAGGIFLRQRKKVPPAHVQQVYLFLCQSFRPSICNG
jgi:hypothetical protein